MKRIVVGLALAVALPLLAACSPGEPADEPTMSGPTPVSSETSEAPDIDAADAYCELAAENISVAGDIEAKANELSAMTPELVAGTAAIEDLHAIADDLLTLDQQMIAFFDDAAPLVADDPVADDFAAMRMFVEDYSVEIANRAKEATSASDYALSVGAFVARPDVQEAIEAGPAAAAEINAYTQARCEIG